MNVRKSVKMLVSSSAVWMGLGVGAGVVLSFLWIAPEAGAVATDRFEDFAVCTTPIDEEMEGIFFLDHLTGDLKGAVLSPRLQRFNATFTYNILSDFGLEGVKNPRFLMVSGQARFQGRTGQVTPANSVIFITELTSGKVAAYGIPWSRSASNANRPFEAALVLLDIVPFRAEVVRDQ